MLAIHATFNNHSQVPSVDDGLRDSDAEVEPDEVQRRDDEDVPDQDLGTDGEHAVAQRVQEPVEDANMRFLKWVKKFGIAKDYRATF